MVSFQAAIAAGMQMVELDVRLTRDRIPVVMHDAKVNRTTNGRGRVRSLTFAQLKELDAGSWFNPIFKGERVPSLSEVLDELGGKIHFNLEIKPDEFEPQQPRDAIELQVVNQLQSRNLIADTLISSFEMRIMERLRNRHADIVLGLLSDGKPAQEMLPHCLRLKAFSWHSDENSLRKADIQHTRRHGIRVMAYTVNQTERFSELLSAGIDGVFSDDPEQLLKTL
jgi:glycerophosphoryl diester phosphodiesterase